MTISERRIDMLYHTIGIACPHFRWINRAVLGLMLVIESLYKEEFLYGALLCWKDRASVGPGWLHP